MAYRPLSDITSCLTGMGADLSTLRNVTVPVEDFQTLKTAYVFRAGRERVFVLFRGSCGVDLDLGINIACRQEQPANGLFGVSASSPHIGVHRGYWRAWQSMEASVFEAVQLLLKEVRSLHKYGSSRSSRGIHRVLCVSVCVQSHQASSGYIDPCTLPPSCCQ